VIDHDFICAARCLQLVMLACQLHFARLVYTQIVVDCDARKFKIIPTRNTVMREGMANHVNPSHRQLHLLNPFHDD
jgi:hypothetical protein